MGLYRRNNSGKWQMLYRDETGRVCRRSTGTADRKAAEIRLAREIEAVERRKLGIPAPSPILAGVATGRLITRYIEHIASEGLSPAYVGNQRSMLERMTARMRWAAIADIRQAEIRQYIAAELEDRTRKTVVAYVEAVRMFCDWAMRQDPPLLAANPAVGVLPRLRGKAGRTARQVVYRRRPLWPHEIPKLLGAPPPETHAWSWNDARRPIYAVALRTGYRRSTLVALRSEHVRIDVANPHIRVPPEMTKSGRGIVTPLDDAGLIRLIERRLALCSAFTLPKEQRGFPFRPVPKLVTLRKDFARAGIDPDEDGQVLDFHSFRYAFCVQLALAGVPLLVARDLMDHASIQTTMRIYAQAGVVETAIGLRSLPRLADLGLPPSPPAARSG